MTRLALIAMLILVLLCGCDAELRGDIASRETRVALRACQLQLAATEQREHWLVFGDGPGSGVECNHPPTWERHTRSKQP